MMTGGFAVFAEVLRVKNTGKTPMRRTGKKQTILRIEPIVDAEKEVKGYMAYTRP